MVGCHWRSTFPQLRRYIFPQCLYTFLKLRITISVSSSLVLNIQSHHFLPLILKPVSSIYLHFAFRIFSSFLSYSFLQVFPTPINRSLIPFTLISKLFLFNKKSWIFLNTTIRWFIPLTIYPDKTNSPYQGFLV